MEADNEKNDPLFQEGDPELPEVLNDAVLAWKRRMRKQCKPSTLERIKRNVLHELKKSDHPDHE